MFSAGCVLHYLGYGTHPFGPYYEREANIRKGRKKMTHVQDQPLLDALVWRLIKHDYAQRPSAAEALAHPLFWPKAKCLAFLMDFSDRLEKVGWLQMRFFNGMLHRLC
jgi:serine/threonine-protein kinase/endoribonuclease IRE1